MNAVGLAKVRQELYDVQRRLLKVVNAMDLSKEEDETLSFEAIAFCNKLREIIRQRPRVIKAWD